MIRAAGGCHVLLCDEKITRSPGFIFNNLHEVMQFIEWVTPCVDYFRQLTNQTSRYAKLKQMRVVPEGNRVYLSLDFTTGQAAGQNMITISSAAIVEWIVQHSPITPRQYFVESNFSGDKKACAFWLINYAERDKWIPY